MPFGGVISFLSAGDVKGEASGISDGRVSTDALDCCPGEGKAVEIGALPCCDVSMLSAWGCLG
jgi:hypothetical protein